MEGGDLGTAIWRQGQWMSADAARGNPMPDGQPWSRALQPFVTHPCQHDHLAGLMKPKVKPVTAEEPGTEPVHVFLARETPLPVPRVRRRLWNRLERKARDRCQPPGGILAQAAPRIVFPSSVNEMFESPRINIPAVRLRTGGCPPLAVATVPSTPPTGSPGKGHLRAIRTATRWNNEPRRFKVQGRIASPAPARSRSSVAQPVARLRPTRLACPRSNLLSTCPPGR